jgi:signal transduction histidine kinase
LLALLIAVLLANYLSGKVRKPILKLVEATREISEGKLDARVTNIGQINEISELAKSFNSMAVSLETDTMELNEASANLKKAYIKADEKNRAYLEMLGFVTHELKSPLASIVFAIGSLRDKLLGALTDAQEDVLKSAARSADYLNSTIANFLNLSRIEEGELKLKISAVNLNKDIIEPAVNRLQEIATDNKMVVEINVPNDLALECDPDLMNSVFQNLISNALKYGLKGTLVKVDSELSNEHVKLSVFNEGQGFSAEDRLNMFTKFSRFSAENYSTKSGTGLGLFVTKNIVLKHNGNIWAESEQGKWAKFSFTVPLKQLSE